ncbi:MAG: surface lipoprotein assembly modifier [Gammaproteobacteria bacterium]|nr:surface lipoprotein assembly modifier [Gammaproteobacteria bacterium]
MKKIPVSRVLVSITLLSLLAVGTAFASSAEPQPSPADESKARALLNNRQFDEALTILRPLAKAHPERTNLHFLLGLAAIERSRLAETSKEEQEALLDEAIATLHKLLVNHPKLERVRLELARAFFYKKEDSLSRKHFKRVLAGNPPPPVAENIQRFLNEIRARKRWSVYLGSTLKPSSNIGRNSETEIINIFGLPFRRDEVEEKKSGVGLSVWAGGGYWHPLAERLRLRFGTDLAREEYPGKEEDQSFLGIHAGPEWLVNAKTSVSLLADARHLWRITSPYYLDFGVRSEIKHRVNRRLWLKGQASWHDRDYRKLDYLDGSTLSLSVNGTWIALPTVRLEGALGYADEHTKSNVWRHDTRWGRIGTLVALPRGFTVGGSAEIRRTRYEGNWFPFTSGVPRKDRTNIYRASVYNRAFTLYGFSPQFVITHEEKDTNSQVYGYDSTGGEIRFVRQF